MGRWWGVLVSGGDCGGIAGSFASCTVRVGVDTASEGSGAPT